MEELIIGDPYLLEFNIIKTCIFHCDYCYLRSSNDKKITFNDFKRFLKKWENYCKKYGFSLNINIMGGDLWLHPEIIKILNYTFNLNFVKHINLTVTNLWLNEAKVLLPKIKSKLSVIQFNLEALEGRYDDLAFLQENKILSGIKIVLSKHHNIKQRIDMAKRLNNMFPDLRVFIDRLCPIHAEEYKYALNLAELKGFILTMAKTFKYFYVEDPLVKTLLNIYKNKSVRLKKDEIGGCMIPNSGLTVFPDGKIKVCSRIPSFNTGFDIDNFDFLKYISKFNYIRKGKEKCKKCRFFYGCQGGCPATSFVRENKFSKDFNCLI